MKVRTVVRRTTDWSRMTLDSLDPYLVNGSKLRTAIELWDKHFFVRYFDYRQKLKQLAKATWAITSDSIETLRYGMTGESNDFMVPTDDDDWFMPDLKKALSDCDSSVEFVTWNAVIHQTVTKHEIQVCNNDYPSNNYAIRLSGLQKLSVHEQYKFLDRHLKCRPLAVKYELRHLHIENPLSTYNKHPGSAHILKSASSLSQLRGLFCEYQCPEYHEFCETLRKVITVPHL